MAPMTTQSVARGWIPDTTTFAARLALVRNAKGWNVKEAAEAAGLPAQSWRNWEDGKRPRDLVTVIEHISTQLGVDRDWLMWGIQADPEGGGRMRASFPLLDGVSPSLFKDELACVA